MTESIPLNVATSVRSKMGKFQQAYGTVSAAEEALGLTIDDYSGHQASEMPGNQPHRLHLPSEIDVTHLDASQIHQLLKDIITKLPFAAFRSILIQSLSDLPSPESSIAEVIRELFKTLVQNTTNQDVCTAVLDNMFSSLSSTRSQLCSLTKESMDRLDNAGKDASLVEKFAKCIATTREDGESKMPLHQMPFGLIEYQIQFFCSEHVNQVIRHCSSSCLFLMLHYTVCLLLD